MAGLARHSRFRVELYDHDANHGPGVIRAVIDDPKDLGVSEYANSVGEFFMTLPISHPLIFQIKPLECHYRAMRWDGVQYQTVGRGVIEDFDATANEVVVYGHDYMGLLETSISNSSTSYTDATLGSIVTDQLSQALTEDDSRLAFTSLGTIDATSVTATLITAFQERLDFLSQVADVSMSDRSVRTLLKLPREAPYEWSFTEDYGQARRAVRLEYGGLVGNFRYIPGFREFATHIRSIGIKREGAEVLYSDQSYAPASTFGRITRTRVFQDITDQTALDRKTKREARRAARDDKFVQVVIRAGKLAPYTTYEVGDFVPVKIQRSSLIDIADNYVIWGQEWTVDPLGRESLFLDLATIDT